MGRGSGVKEKLSSFSLGGSPSAQSFVRMRRSPGRDQEGRGGVVLQRRLSGDGGSDL
jgi:hypothetical protein